VTIDSGSSDGIRVDDPVVAAQGLAGKITQTTPNTAQVTLITDADSAVTARVQPSGATGVVEPNVGNPNDLQLDFLERAAQIAEGQMVVTAGFSTGDLGSIFPPGIPIGKITRATVEEQQAYQRVHLSPFADLRDMDFVKVLTTHSEVAPVIFRPGSSPGWSRSARSRPSPRSSASRRWMSSARARTSPSSSCFRSASSAGAHRGRRGLLDGAADRLPAARDSRGFALTLLSVGYVAGRYRETVGRPTRGAVAARRRAHPARRW
jgi:rod shape-determining protein MreC